MATHSNILTWEIPWTEEPAGYSPWDFQKKKKSDTIQQLNNKSKSCSYLDSTSMTDSYFLDIQGIY